MRRVTDLKKRQTLVLNMHMHTLTHVYTDTHTIRKALHVTVEHAKDYITTSGFELCNHKATTKTPPPVK